MYQPDPVRDPFAFSHYRPVPDRRALEPVTRRILGLDLGGQHDFSALALLEYEARIGQRPTYLVRALHRWKLRTPLPIFLEDVERSMQAPEMHGALLVTDYTGLGRPIGDMLFERLARAKIQAAGMVKIVITAGREVTCVGEGVHNCAKVALVGSLAAVLQTRRVQIAKLPETRTLDRELSKFKLRITRSGTETFAAESERIHDDLLMAVMLAIFVAETIAWPDNAPLAGPTRMRA